MIIIEEKGEYNDRILQNIKDNIKKNPTNIRKIQENIFFIILENELIKQGIHKELTDILKEIFSQNIWSIKDDLIKEYNKKWIEKEKKGWQDIIEFFIRFKKNRYIKRNRN